MATSGPKTGGTSGNAGAWTTPDNAKVTDATYATKSLPALTPAGDLSMSNYGFSIPGGSTILGIQVDIVRHASAATSITFASTNAGAGVSITKTANTRTGTAKFDSTTWGTSDATTTFGGGSDLWGTTFTVAEINATGFGVAMDCENDNPSLSRTASIDSISITVTYTPPASGLLAFFFRVVGIKRETQVRCFFPEPVSI